MGHGESFSNWRGRFGSRNKWNSSCDVQDEREFGRKKEREKRNNKNKFPIKIFYRFSLHIWHQRGNRFRISCNKRYSDFALCSHSVCAYAVKSEKSTFNNRHNHRMCSENETTVHIEMPHNSRNNVYKPNYKRHTWNK